jgi:hypothetical protein
MIYVTLSNSAGEPTAQLLAGLEERHRLFCPPENAQGRHNTGCCR